MELNFGRRDEVAAKVRHFGPNLLKSPRGQMGTKPSILYHRLLYYSLPAKVGHVAPGAI
jgi:hypothetical protein